MCVALKCAVESDVPMLWEMQVEAFRPLLEKYQSEVVNPACESVEKVRARFRHPCSDYYVIYVGEVPVGGVRVIRRKGARCQISPLFILPEHQRKGYACAAIRRLEEIYPNMQWELNTILEEKGNCRLYEKMGYRRTGEYERINEQMTLVYYRKKRNLNL